MADPGRVVNSLTKLETLDEAPWVESGTVQLFHHADFNSSRHILRLDDWLEGERFMLDRAFVDNVTYVAWNLPLGTVVTITENHQSRGSQGIGNLSDLRNYGMNDIASSWFWREVDLKYGAIELFEHIEFEGARVTIFLSEWLPGTYYNIPGWYMDDNMSSLRWWGLVDKQRVMLSEHWNGEGNSYNNIKSWGSSKEVADIATFGFSDRASCFRWDPILPLREIIQPILISTSGSSAQQVGDTLVYENKGNTEQQVSFSVKKTTSQTLTIATEETHVAGITSSLGMSASGGIPGTAETEVSFSLELSYEYTHNKTSETSTTEEVEINVQHTVKAAPKGRTEARLIASLGKVPETWYATKATRWYDQQVTGSVRDNSTQGGGNFKREEIITVQVAGGLVSSTRISVDFFPY